MRTNAREQGGYTMKLGGAGAVTRGMVRTRAAELAVVHGRPRDQPSTEDLAQATAELTGEAEGDHNDPALETALECMGGDAYGEEDGRSDCERLVDGGVREAQNDQMLQASRGDWDDSIE